MRSPIRAFVPVVVACGLLALNVNPSLAAAGGSSTASTSSAAHREKHQKVQVIVARTHDVSPPLSSLQNPQPASGVSAAAASLSPATAAGGSPPTQVASFEGSGPNGDPNWLRPDSNGAVGVNNYVETVNDKVVVFDRS
ncbi:MAG TPA: hypothetical protein VG015_09235, partial [Candidatus Dormibacteraeota bacterium]|nr:hypothetical protein [Candidatus Dormibacteraeota bacterium]